MLIAVLATAGLASGLVAARAANAQPQEERFEVIEPGDMAALMQSWGYRAELDAYSDGRPVIRSAASGLNFDVRFFNCTEGKTEECRDLQFQVGFTMEPPPTLDTFNTWNSDFRFARSYLWEGRTAYMEMDLRLDGGVHGRHGKVLSGDLRDLDGRLRSPYRLLTLKRVSGVRRRTAPVRRRQGVGIGFLH